MIDYVTPDRRQDFEDWVSSTESRLAVDTETSGLDPWNDELRLVQFSDGQDAWVLPYPQERPLIARCLSQSRELIGHRTKFDAQFLSLNGLPTHGLVHDTKIQCHLLDSAGSTGLKKNGLRYLGIEPQSEKALKSALRKNKWRWGTVPQDFELYWQYAGNDALLTANLFSRLRSRVMVGQLGGIYSLESDVWRILMEAEQAGMLVDRGYVGSRVSVLGLKTLAITQRWPDVNLNSVQQIGNRLFDDLLGLHFGRTPKGQTKVDRETLERVDHPLARDVLEYRALNKSLSTYYRNFLERCDERGRLHPTINTVGPVTGRMSCERPNLQNVPIRDGPDVRNSFVAAPGHVFVAADYSQIEYRIMASLAGEPEMIASFLRGEDFHEATARIMLGHDPSSRERYTAKTSNFAMIYGAQPAKLAKVAGISPSAAREFMQQYRETFPRAGNLIRSMAKYVENAARITGSTEYSVETAYGRRIPVDAGRTYAALNYEVQGTAADVLKRAIRVIGGTWLRPFLRLPVHDDLLFEVPEDAVDDAVAELPRLMRVDDFDVPLTVVVKQGRRWGSMV